MVNKRFGEVGIPMKQVGPDWRLALEAGGGPP